MLHEYLTSAQDVLVAKKEIYDVKNRRLRLAEDEYNMLTAMAASRNSCKYLYSCLQSNGTVVSKTLTKKKMNDFVYLFVLLSLFPSVYSSSSSISTRHDPELLKAELAMAKERVWRLKRELLQINSDITYTQRGVDTLNS